jgi:hypothetical protein
LGSHIEQDRNNGLVRYEIRGAFGQTFQGTVNPVGLNIQDFKDMPLEYLEDLKASVKVGEGKSDKEPLGVLDRPYHDKPNYHSKDLRMEPQVEQWVA